MKKTIQYKTKSGEYIELPLRMIDGVEKIKYDTPEGYKRISIGEAMKQRINALESGDEELIFQWNRFGILTRNLLIHNPNGNVKVLNKIPKLARPHHITDFRGYPSNIYFDEETYGKIDGKEFSKEEFGKFTLNTEEGNDIENFGLEDILRNPILNLITNDIPKESLCKYILQIHSKRGFPKTFSIQNSVTEKDTQYGPIGKPLFLSEVSTLIKYHNGITDSSRGFCYTVEIPIDLDENKKTKNTSDNLTNLEKVLSENLERNLDNLYSEDLINSLEKVISEKNIPDMKYTLSQLRKTSFERYADGLSDLKVDDIAGLLKAYHPNEDIINKILGE